MRTAEIDSSCHAVHDIYKVAQFACMNIDTIFSLHHQAPPISWGSKSEDVEGDVLNEVELWNPQVVILWNAQEQRMVTINCYVQTSDVI